MRTINELIAGSIGGAAQVIGEYYVCAVAGTRLTCMCSGTTSGHGKDSCSDRSQYDYTLFRSLIAANEIISSPRGYVCESEDTLNGPIGTHYCMGPERTHGYIEANPS